MAPRRRVQSQTPIRASNDEDGVRSARRNTRATPARNHSRQSYGGSENAHERPTLPDVQPEQSFTYGSNKTPLLPRQLKARERMTVNQMAETLDEEMNQAEANLAAQAQQTADHYSNHNREHENQMRDQRARRRESLRGSASSAEPETPVDESRQTSVIEQPGPDLQIRRGHNALRQDSSNLSTVPENSVNDVLPISSHDKSRKPNDAVGTSSVNSRAPSYGPDHITGTPIVPDISYVAERNVEVDTPMHGNAQRVVAEEIRRTQTLPGPSWRQASSQQSHGMPNRLGQLLLLIRERLWDYENDELVKLSLRLSASQLLRAYLLFCFAITLILIALPGTRRSLYVATANVRAGMNHLFHPYENMNNINDSATRNVLQDFEHRLEKATRQIDVSEKGIASISSKISASDKEISTIVSKIEDSERQINALAARLDHTAEAVGRSQRGNQGSVPIPLAQINYAAESHGAIADPTLSSPTKHRNFDFWTRLTAPKFVEAHRSRPPIEALRPWSEPGDCWCASPSNDDTHLAIILPEKIYPTEVVYEHFPTRANPNAAMAPRKIQIWADYSGLSRTEFEDVKRVMWRDLHPTLPNTWLLAGVLEYKISDEDYIQTVMLNGADEMKWATNKFLFRITENYGGQMTCMYRVRVHGKPVEPHPSPKVNGENVGSNPGREGAQKRSYL
ncbi:MAG: hypothetical protein Q9227_005846 [Pyrenula ochraceoflavens]